MTCCINRDGRARVARSWTSQHGLSINKMRLAGLTKPVGPTRVASNSYNIVIHRHGTRHSRYSFKYSLTLVFATQHRCIIPTNLRKDGIDMPSLRDLHIRGGGASKYSAFRTVPLAYTVLMKAHTSSRNAFILAPMNLEGRGLNREPDIRSA